MAPPGSRALPYQILKETAFAAPEPDTLHCFGAGAASAAFGSGAGLSERLLR
jgi:hypothetical protein